MRHLKKIKVSNSLQNMQQLSIEEMQTIFGGYECVWDTISVMYRELHFNKVSKDILDTATPENFRYAWGSFLDKCATEYLKCGYNESSNEYKACKITDDGDPSPAQYNMLHSFMRQYFDLSGDYSSTPSTSYNLVIYQVPGQEEGKLHSNRLNYGDLLHDSNGNTYYISDDVNTSSTEIIYTSWIFKSVGVSSFLE